MYRIIVSISSLWLESSAANSWTGLLGATPIDMPRASPFKDRQYWAMSWCSSSLQIRKHVEIKRIIIMFFNLRFRCEIFVDAVYNGRGCWMHKYILRHARLHLRRDFRLSIRRSGGPFQSRLNGQITQTRMFLKVALRLEFVAQGASEIFQILSRRGLQNMVNKMRSY